jgi:hypothetical protein
MVFGWLVGKRPRFVSLTTDKLGSELLRGFSSFFCFFFLFCKRYHNFFFIGRRMERYVYSFGSDHTWKLSKTVVCDTGSQGSWLYGSIRMSSQYL